LTAAVVIRGGGCGGRRSLRRVDHELQLGFWMGVAGEQNLAPSVVGRWTSIIWTAANLSSALRAVNPGAKHEGGG